MRRCYHGTTMNSPILRLAALHAAGTVAYVTLVATFLYHAAELFGDGPDRSVLIPIAMLLLFVVSATITGSLVLGRPVLWYIDGKKKEAVTLFIATVGFLALAMILAFTGLGLLTQHS